MYLHYLTSFSKSVDLCTKSSINYKCKKHNNNFSERSDAMNNADLRARAKKKSVLLWQVAERLNISDTQFSKMLRHELPKEKKKEALEAIEAIAAEKNAAL